MKKTLFTLMLSAFAFVSLEAAHAGKTNQPQENDKKRTPAVKPIIAKQSALPKPDFSNLRPRTPKWMPCAPVNPHKNRASFAEWVRKVQTNPDKYKIQGTTPFIFE